LIFYVFDLLFVRNEDLRGLPLAVRKARLQQLLESLDAKSRRVLRYVDHLESEGEAVLAGACRMSLEGIIAKRLEAPYASGRGHGWSKAKCRAGQEVIIGGWTIESGHLRALLVGVHRGGQLTYVGRVGTGFGAPVVKRLLPKLKALTQDKS